jgi:hypothetical protein
LSSCWAHHVQDDGFGGDIEIFAVRGKHVTDWHFDAQEVRELQSDCIVHRRWCDDDRDD